MSAYAATLDGVRGFLGKMEDYILTDLYMRSCSAANQSMYEPESAGIPGSPASHFEHFLRQRLLSPSSKLHIIDEVPIFRGRPVQERAWRRRYPMGPTGINTYRSINEAYMRAVRQLCADGDDGEWDSAALSDMVAVDSLIARIQRGGIWVADLKFMGDPDRYRDLARMGDSRAKTETRGMVTNPEQESRVLARVREKGAKNGIDPDFAETFFSNDVIPLTREVEVQRILEVANRNPP
jgi:hypothetical protein